MILIRGAKTDLVIGVGIRRHGRSDAGPPDTRGNMAAEVLEFMDRPPIRGGAHFGRYSMGRSLTFRILTTNTEKLIMAS